ncbi:hypothetical protein MBLNU459_g3966t1 [Dothideomycetes sp. NU459]
MVTCNTTLADQTIEEDPVFSHVKFHHIGLVVSAVFALISVIISFFLIYKHATHYSKPWEQKHIIRIILMIPVYSTVSFLSYLFYKHSIYFEVLRDCYEAFAIAAFFTLLCHYIAPNLHDQKDYFRQLQPINWFWGVFGLQKCTGGKYRGCLRIPGSGLTWFNVIWIGVFQYCFIRVLFTIVSVVTQATGRYCESSLNPAFAKIWVEAFESAAVTVAMFCLIQFYLQLRSDLAEHRPFLKVLSIKLVIFFSFWQTLVISFLSSSSGPLQPTKKVSYADIQVGIPSMLLCIEMAIFAVMHLFAFPWREYDLSKEVYLDPINAPGSGYSGPKPVYQGGWMGSRALLDTFNPWDIIKAFARGARWMFVGYKHRREDSSYTNKLGGSLSDQGTSIPGPHVTSDSAPSGTELRKQSRGRADTYGVESSDRSGLLSHAQAHALSPSPSPSRRGDSFDDRSDGGDAEARSGDLSMAPHAQIPLPDASHFGGNDAPRLGLNRWDTDTGYHAAPTAPSNSATIGMAVGGPEDQWDHWAGARSDDQSSTRPPTYHTTEH